MRILFVTGPVCAGKTTYIKEKFGWADIFRVSVGEIATNLARRKGVDLFSLIDPVTFLCKEEDEIRRELAATIKGFQAMGRELLIVDGFPRSVEQIEWIIKNFMGEAKCHVQELIVDKSVLYDRMKRRARETDSEQRLTAELDRFGHIHSYIDINRLNHFYQPIFN